MNCIDQLKTTKVFAGLLASMLLVLLLAGCSAQTGSGESGEGAGTEEGGEEASGALLPPDASFSQTRSGALLQLDYEATVNSFVGTVANTTDSMLPRVRVEVHLDTGTELGPTSPVDMAPGNVIQVTLPATGEAFTGWTAHAEVGGNAAEEAGEHGPGGESIGERGGEHGSGTEHSGGS